MDILAIENITYEMCKTNKCCAELTEILTQIIKILTHQVNINIICKNTHEDTFDEKKNITNNTPEQKEESIARILRNT
jgi:hypothetical protein